jgi:hypothetical protein
MHDIHADEKKRSNKQLIHKKILGTIAFVAPTL